jgi:hypothetical protein
MRSLWAALALFACGDVPKVPDAANLDAFQPDSPPMPLSCAAGEMVCNGSCANLMTSDLYCGNCNTQCSPTQGCLNGACVDKASRCTSIRIWNPSAGDGVYYNPNIGSHMYCDFTNGITYEGFGFGAFNTNYGSNWALMSSANLNDTNIRRAFVALYNQQGGLINLGPGFNSSNCCFKSSDAGAGQMLYIANSYVFPAKSGSNMYQCGGPYNDPRYRFWEGLNDVYSPLPMPDDYWTTHAASVAANCSDSTNPGIFMRRRFTLN